MKRIILILALAYYAQSGMAQTNRFWIATSAGNWNSTANWSTTTGGTGGASVPGSTEVAVFDGAGGRNGACNLNMAPTTAGVSINGYTGMIDLRGNVFTTTGTNLFRTGTVANTGATADIVLNSTGTSTFSGTLFSTGVSGSSGAILLSGSVFQSTVSLTKTGNSNDAGAGGNIFDGAVTLTQAGSGQWQLAVTNPDIFNSTLAVVSNSTGSTSLARAAAGNQFRNNIVVHYNSTGGVSLGANGGTSTLSSGFTISIGTVGASGCGSLLLANFTQAGTTSQSITLSGNNTATLTLGPSTTFNGNLTVVTPSIQLNTATFQRVTQITKTGQNADNLRGGNVFNGAFTVNNQGADVVFGSVISDPGDRWNALATFNNSGGNRIRVSEESSGNTFAADAVFNCLGNVTDVADRIQISRLAGGATTFNGTTTFNNNGETSDFHISYDAGTSTIFNGPVFLNVATTGASENWIAVEGNVTISSTITITNTSTNTISMGQGGGLVSLTGSISAVSGFSAGRLHIRNVTQTGSAPHNVAMTGAATLRVGPGATLTGTVDFRAPQILLDGARFQRAAYIEKTGATGNDSDGGNIFDGATTLANSGSGSFNMGNANADTFNSTLTVSSTGTDRIQLAVGTAGNVCQGDATFTFGGTAATTVNMIVARNTGSSFTFNGKLSLTSANGNTGVGIYMGSDGSVTANGDVTVGCSGGRVYLGNTVNSSFTLAANAKLIASSFTTGELRLSQFKQVSNTAQFVELTGNALMSLYPATSFEGDIDMRAPQLYVSAITAQRSARLEKTGATDNSSPGNSTFVGPATIINSGTGQLRMNGNNVFNSTAQIVNAGSRDVLLENTTGSTYAGTATFINSGSSTIRVAFQGNTTFQGDMIFSSTSGGGILFCENVAGSATLTTGRTMSIGGGGFSTGNLWLRSFTQTGNTPQTLTAFTGTALLTVGPGSALGGPVIFRAPQVQLHGCTYGSTAIIEKNGATPNDSNGGNIFQGDATITNSGTGWFSLGNVNADQFGAAATFHVTGAARIYVANSHAGQTTTFAGNATFNASKTAAGDNWAFLIGESANTNVLFNGSVTLNNTGTIRSDCRFANNATTNVTFGGDVTLLVSNTNSATALTMGNNGTTLYQGNIIVSNSGGASGIFFNGGTGTATLVSGRTISLGGAFDAGNLSLTKFQQQGSGTAQNIVLPAAGTAILTVGGGSTFDGDATLAAPQVYLNGATYNRTATISKTGATDNTSTGGNTFVGTSLLTNSGIGRMRLANSTADAFVGAVTFVKTNTGVIEPGYNAISTFAGNITTNSATTVLFGGGSGGVEFTGGAAQSVNKTGGTASPNFERMRLNKSGSAVTLNTDLTIATGGSATFVTGILNTTAANYLNFASTTTAVTGANDASYVDGPVRKTGTMTSAPQTFTFPVGGGGFYRPITISGLSGAANYFTAQYFKSAQSYGGKATWDPSFYTVSACEYWILDRGTAAPNVTVTLSWNENACGGAGYVTNPSDLRVARWTGTAWANHGGASISGTSASGTVTTSAAVSSFSPFTLASVSRNNPLPVTLASFEATNQGSVVALDWVTTTEINSESFTLQRSLTGLDYETIYTTAAAGNTIERTPYSFVDEEPYSGLSYYRLIQTDFDGATQSWLTSVVRGSDEMSFQVSPNPAGAETVHFNQPATVVVLNNLEQVVMQAQHTTSLDVSRLAAGVYLIRNQKGEVARLIKR
jgi:hypothetical protein